MSADLLIWRVALIGAVFAIDLVVFIALCREELRDCRASRGTRGSALIGESESALPAHSR